MPVWATVTVCDALHVMQSEGAAQTGVPPEDVSPGRPLPSTRSLAEGARMRVGAVGTTSLVVVSVLVSVAIAELAVRSMNLEPPPMWEFNRTVGWRYQPGLRTWYRTSEFTSWVEINATGLHDREHAYTKAADVFRVLLLGDSFTAAIEVPFENSFARILEKRLNELAAPKRVEVINAGVGGFSTVNELLMFREEGTKYKPDLVLLFLVDPDIRDNFHLTAENVVPGAPYFALIDGHLVLRHFPTGALTSVKRYVGRLRIVRLAYRIFASLGPRLAAGEKQHSDLSAPHALSMASLYAERRRPEWEQAIEITRTLVRELDREVGATGGRLAVVSFGSTVSGEVQGRSGTGRGGPERELQEFFASLRIPSHWLGHCLDNEDRIHGRPVRFSHDRHFNTHGHELVAADLEAFLRDHDLLPGVVAHETAEAAHSRASVPGLTSPCRASSDSTS